MQLILPHYLNLHLIIICTGKFSLSCYTLRNNKSIPETPAKQTCVNKKNKQKKNNLDL